MDGLKAQPGGDLGEIEPPFPDHTPGGLYFQPAEILHHPAAGVAVEQLLQLAAANEVVPADLLQSKILLHPLFHVAQHTVQVVILCPAGKNLYGRGALAADQADEQLLQSGGKQGLSAERGLRAALEGSGGGVVEGGGKGGAALLHNAGQQASLTRSHKGDQPPEEVHVRAVALKAHHHQVGSHPHRGEGMKLSGGVEDNLPLEQIMNGVPGGDPHQPFIHIQKLPEIVGLSGKGIVAGIFKVVNGVELLNGQGTFQSEWIIGWHGGILSALVCSGLIWRRSDCASGIPWD